MGAQPPPQSCIPSAQCQRHRTVGTGGQRHRSARKSGVPEEWSTLPPHHPGVRKTWLMALVCWKLRPHLGPSPLPPTPLRLDGCPRIGSVQQIEMHFVLIGWQQGWSLTALWPVKLEPRPSRHSTVTQRSAHSDTQTLG